jgi:predicted DNA-binding transcriptional regulator YafY
MGSKMQFEDITHKASEAVAIESAIDKLDIVTFSYSFDNKKKNSTVKPLRIINFDGFWYLLAMDINDDDIIKKYYLKNISNIKPTDKKFKIPKELDEKLKNAINIWFDANADSFEIRLYADPTCAKYIKRRPISQSQTIISNDTDGGAEISLKITEYYEIMPTIFQWIPHLFVLEPIELKEQVSQAVKEFMERDKIIKN